MEHRVGRDAAVLSLIEVGLGSLLHAFHFPMRGHILSLNQSAFLTRSTLASSRWQLGWEVSSVAGLLKSLSPAGSRLTPMIAIASQGAIFSLCCLVLGAGRLGTWMGSVLSSVWAFVQPLILYYLLFGHALVEVLERINQMLKGVIDYQNEDLLRVLLIAVGVKAVLAVGVWVFVNFLSDSKWDRYEKAWVATAQKGLQQRGKVMEQRSAWRGALRDLSQPMFLFSFALTGGFFFFAIGPSSQLVWILLRPIAIGFLIFYFVRKISFETILSKLERMGFNQFSKVLRGAAQQFFARS